jgi:hypothetical protein
MMAAAGGLRARFPSAGLLGDWRPQVDDDRAIPVGLLDDGQDLTPD